MATTRSAFAKITSGSTPVLVAANSGVVNAIVSGGIGSRVDLQTVNLETAGFAKNGAARYSLSGTTPADIDLTDLTSGSQSYAGDATVAKWQQIQLYNDGAATVTVTPGVSNGATVPITSLSVEAGEKHVINSTAGKTIDATHKILTVTPTSGGSFIILVGGTAT